MSVQSNHPFILGINYWPRCKAMYWWKDFSEKEVKREFKQMKSLHLNLVRIFLLWEDFQPASDKMNLKSVKNLQSVLNIANQLNLQILVTLFTGHMSGVNWIPAWALSREKRNPQDYRSVSKNRIRNYKIGYFYRNSALLKAQCFFIRQLIPTVKNHPSLYGWDLGNEPSLLLRPRKVNDVIFWIKRLTQEIKKLDPDHPITLGMHQGDLSYDTKFHPKALKQYIDIPSMHGYPNYSHWAQSPFDSKSLSFLNSLTERMTKKKVLFAEFGLPTFSSSIKESKMFYAKQDRASRYFKNALNQLHRIGALGALVWCYADYHPKFKYFPPFDQAPHELCFGIINWKGKIKKTGRVLSQWAERKRNVRSSPIFKNFSTRKYFRAPAKNLSRLYQFFLKQI